MVLDKKYEGYTIRIRELIEEIEEEEQEWDGGKAILSFPRQHLSIQKPDGGFFKDKEIVKLIAKAISKDEKLKKRWNLQF